MRGDAEWPSRGRRPIAGRLTSFAGPWLFAAVAPPRATDGADAKNSEIQM